MTHSHDLASSAELLGLVRYDQREAGLLAPYAMHSANSAGRKYPEAEHPYRGPYQRDRDRIIHSAAYRRLSDKTQVFTAMGDYHRTRLTHTQEVASIARTMGRALRLNEDLIEALALLHDIGHPPFGHAGEDALSECLEHEGGFSHNRYGLTLVELLESRSPDFPGLNLTQEVLEGQATRAVKGKKAAESPLLEVQVVEAADSITYDAHDTDDAVKLGLVKLEELEEIPIVAENAARVRELHPGIEGDLLRKRLVHQLIDVQVSHVLLHSGKFLATSGWQSTADVRRSPFRVAADPAMIHHKSELEKFLYQRVYRHPAIMRLREEGQRRLKQMFAAYVKHPDWMPEKFQLHAQRVGVNRSVADYLAGMTDRYCEQQYVRLATEVG